MVCFLKVYFRNVSFIFSNRRNVKCCYTFKTVMPNTGISNKHLEDIRGGIETKTEAQSGPVNIYLGFSTDCGSLKA